MHIGNTILPDKETGTDMNLEKFTDRAKGFLQSALTVAIRMNHQQIAPEHLLKALLEDEQGLAAGLIQQGGGDAKKAVSETEVSVLKVETTRPPLSAANMLQLPEGSDALHVVRVRSRDGIPLMLLDAWMPPRFASRISHDALKVFPLYQLLLGDDMQLGEVIQEVTAEMADPAVPERLNVAVNAPILRMTRLVDDSQQHPFQYLVIRASPQRSRLVMSIPGEHLNSRAAGHLVHDLA